MHVCVCVCGCVVVYVSGKYRNVSGIYLDLLFDRGGIMLDCGEVCMHAYVCVCVVVYVSGKYSNDSGIYLNLYDREA